MTRPPLAQWTVLAVLASLLLAPTVAADQDDEASNEDLARSTFHDVDSSLSCNWKAVHGTGGQLEEGEWPGGQEMQDTADDGEGYQSVVMEELERLIFNETDLFGQVDDLEDDAEGELWDAFWLLTQTAENESAPYKCFIFQKTLIPIMKRHFWEPNPQRCFTKEFTTCGLDKIECAVLGTLAWAIDRITWPPHLEPPACDPTPPIGYEPWNDPLPDNEPWNDPVPGDGV